MTDIPKILTPSEALAALAAMTEERSPYVDEVHVDSDMILLAALRHAGPEYAAVADAWEACDDAMGGFWYD